MPLARLVKVALALWLVHWAAGEAAAYLGRHGDWPKRRRPAGSPPRTDAM